MKRLDRLRLLPHELCFGGFLLLTWVRLLLTAGPLTVLALGYLGLIAANVGVIAWSQRRDTALRRRLRQLYYPLAMNAVFFTLGPVVASIGTPPADAFLERVDGWLIGTNLSLRSQAVTTPALTEFFSLCYILFFPYLTFSIIWYIVGDVKLLEKFFCGLFTIYGLGFIGYTLLPAGGPYLAMPDQFTVPLDGWWITRWNDAIVRAGSNGVDVFPSLHCAISCYILSSTARTGRGASGGTWSPVSACGHRRSIFDTIM